jgi:vancomycin resistance protein YoaR
LVVFFLLRSVRERLETIEKASSSHSKSPKKPVASSPMSKSPKGQVTKTSAEDNELLQECSSQIQLLKELNEKLTKDIVSIKETQEEMEENNQQRLSHCEFSFLFCCYF